MEEVVKDEEELGRFVGTRWGRGRDMSQLKFVSAL